MGLETPGHAEPEAEKKRMKMREEDATGPGFLSHSDSVGPVGGSKALHPRQLQGSTAHALGGGRRREGDLRARAVSGARKSGVLAPRTRSQGMLRQKEAAPYTRPQPHPLP